MEFSQPLINRETIVDLLYGDEDYISDFASASIESFTEFKTKFSKSLKSKDMKSLREAGHKIKPVAQMMKLETVNKMYESSKIMLEENASDQEINNLVKKMNNFCSQVIKELKQFQ